MSETTLSDSPLPATTLAESNSARRPNPRTADKTVTMALILIATLLALLSLLPGS